MNKIIKKSWAILILVTQICVGQSFEGIIQWKLEMQMAGGNQKMPEITPEQKAQMEQMMNNPQMKAMIENNPQMKAQMEMIKKMSAGGGMSDMMPKGFTIKLKDGNSLVNMEGGMMSGKEYLTIPSKKERLTIDRNSKTFSKRIIQDNKSEKTDIKVTKTEEFIVVSGYKCRKYLVEKTEMGKKLVSEVYNTTELKGVDPNTFKKMSIGGQGGESFYAEGMEGIPMKIKTSIEQGTVVMEVVSITKKTLASTDFSVPADFTETK